MKIPSALTDRNTSFDSTMTPMIDVVFQLIIFFVVTAAAEKDQFNQKILLAFSPHGPAIEQKDPRTVTVEVDVEGSGAGVHHAARAVRGRTQPLPDPGRRRHSDHSHRR